MKNVHGVWLPDGETHMLEVMLGDKRRDVDGKPTYQYKKLARALGFIPPERRRTCIDIGAHVGTWSMHLVREFAELHAFEPVAAHRDCYRQNVGLPSGWLGPCLDARDEGRQVYLHDCALGDKEDCVAMKETGWSTGSAHVWGKGDIPMRTLDSFGFVDVDFIKIDVEGLELAVVKGAEETIRVNRPWMVVEQKGREVKTYGAPARDAAVQWLERHLGMRPLDCISGDWILGW